MTSKEALNRILFLEEDLGIYDFEIKSVKLWNLYRISYRYRYISMVTGIPSITNPLKKKHGLIEMSRKFYNSFIELIKIICFHKKFQNVIFPIGRLQNNGGELFDKFTDPVIDLSNLKESVCIFERAMHYTDGCKRRHNNIVLSTDFLNILFFFLIPFYFILHLFNGHLLTIFKLFVKVRKIMPMSFDDLLHMNISYLKFQISNLFYSFLFKKMSVKRVMGVDRQHFNTAIYSAHKLKIPVYEFQHGVTYGDSEYYSGRRCDMITPDYFLSFGELWKGNQFGIDPSKIINIGWAYKEETNLSQVTMIPNSVLFISSPEITHSILATAKELAIAYPQLNFYIRCHPYEKYSAEQLQIVNQTRNLSLDDNTIDSLIALCKYQYVIGENSSVVYEALSLGKIVGRLCYNGISSIRNKDFIEDGFVYLFGIEDFENLLKAYKKSDDNLAYSSFKKEVVNNLPQK